MLAPIGLSVYGRVEHTRKTVEALQRNTLASDSVLYVFSDASKPGDEEKVARMREFIRSIEGFKAVNIVERLENSRVRNNRGGIQYLLDNYGKAIFMEEDVVTAPGFLKFMNDALEFYRDNPKIGSISGYCPPIGIPEHYTRDFFTLTRMNPWGVGLWQRYFKMDTPIPADRFHAIFKDKNQLRQLECCVGEEASQYIEMNFEGKLDAGDMKTIFWQYIDDKLTVYPRMSLVNCIGQDSSGVHMGKTAKWDVKQLWNKTDGFVFSDDVDVDEDIREAHFRFYKANKFKIGLIKQLDSMGLYRFIKPVARVMRRILNKLGNG